MFVYTCADNHLLLIMQRQLRHHEMNMLASGSLKPAVSHFYSFVLSLLFQLANNIYFQLNKERSCEISKVRK